MSIYTRIHGFYPLQWRHNGRDSVSNHQPNDCFLVYLDTDQRKHQSSASLAFVRGIHRRPVNSPYKWPVTREMFPFDDVIMCPISQWQPPEGNFTRDTSAIYKKNITWKISLKSPKGQWVKVRCHTFPTTYVHEIVCIQCLALTTTRERCPRCVFSSLW